MEPDPHIGFPLPPMDFHCSQWNSICFASFSNPENGKTFCNGIPFLGMDSIPRIGFSQLGNGIPFLGMDSILRIGFPKVPWVFLCAVGTIPIVSLDFHSSNGLPSWNWAPNAGNGIPSCGDGRHCCERRPVGGIGVFPIGGGELPFIHDHPRAFVWSPCGVFSVSNRLLVQRSFQSELCHCCWCKFPFLLFIVISSVSLLTII